jgi:hypothetical protein
MRRSRPHWAAALALVVVSAAAGRDARIRPGVGIGRVDLGMTQAQVRRALGPHDTGWSEQRGLGVRYLELTWARGPDDYFAVGLLGRPGRLRVVSIATTRRAETYRGIGAGATIARLRRTIRGLRCLDSGRPKAARSSRAASRSAAGTGPGRSSFGGSGASTEATREPESRTSPCAHPRRFTK